MLLYTYILHIGTNTGIFRPYVMNFYRTTHMFRMHTVRYIPLLCVFPSQAGTVSKHERTEPFSAQSLPSV